MCCFAATFLVSVRSGAAEDVHFRHMCPKDPSRNLLYFVINIESRPLGINEAHSSSLRLN